LFVSTRKAHLTFASAIAALASSDVRKTNALSGNTDATVPPTASFRKSLREQVIRRPPLGHVDCGIQRIRACVYDVDHESLAGPTWLRPGTQAMRDIAYTELVLY
jgi:hypothetical protein